MDEMGLSARGLLAVKTCQHHLKKLEAQSGLPASADLSPLTLETSNALLSPLRSHFRLRAWD